MFYMNKKRTAFPFRLTVQTILKNREQLNEFEDHLALLHQIGFYGIELNLPDLQVLTPNELKKVLKKHDLALTYIATGAFAKERGYSLSTSDAEIRAASVNGVLENAAFAKEMGAGVILGFFKGGPSADSSDPELYLEKSLREICDQKPRMVPVLLEATNRKETSVVHRISEGVKITSAVQNPDLFVLPDTYHMAFEENDMADAVVENLSLIKNIHLSDNNRFFPGFGTIDFKMFLSTLLRCGYSGTLGIEGNIKSSFSDDIRESFAFLNSLSIS